MPDRLVPIDGWGAGQWLRRSLTTFAIDVGSFLPDHFEAYARIDHTDADQRAEGSLPRDLIAPLVEHLRIGTSTPDQCYFAVWEGFGVGQVTLRFEAGTSRGEKKKAWASIPGPESWKSRSPTLELPARSYHVFSGPIEGATSDLSGSGLDFRWQSANLWWPADHAWCVATEVDFEWTYVGGSRACIAAILADVNLGATERTARSTR